MNIFLVLKVESVKPPQSWGPFLIITWIFAGSFVTFPDHLHSGSLRKRSTSMKPVILSNTYIKLAKIIGVSFFDNPEKGPTFPEKSAECVRLRNWFKLIFFLFLSPFFFFLCHVLCLAQFSSVFYGDFIFITIVFPVTVNFIQGYKALRLR